MVEKRHHPTVLLCWVLSSLPARLCCNVLREIHDYMQGPFIAQVQRPNYLYVFDVGNRSWRTAVLAKPLQVIFPEGFLMISSSEVFLAGLTGSSTVDVSSAFIVDLTGAVREQPDMLVKGQPGLFHNQADNTVLAFGGGWEEPLNVTQVYSLFKRQWSLLEQKMKYPRCGFTPCQYLSSVYLIGGTTGQVESFSLKSYTFTVIWDLPIPLCVQYAPAVCDNKIYLIYHAKCKVFDLRERKYIIKRRFLIDKVHTFGAVLVQDNIFTVRYPHYWTMNITSWVNSEQSA